jgi:hypothetical protein
MEGREHGFRTVIVSPADPHWAGRVLEGVGQSGWSPFDRGAGNAAPPAEEDEGKCADQKREGGARLGGG